MRRGERKGFDKNGNVLCKSCFEKDLDIRKLREQLAKYTDKERFNSNKNAPNLKEQPHMPSSRKTFKKNTNEDNKNKKGGAKNGHKGHGRKKGTQDANEILEHACHCPDCKVALSTKDIKPRTIVEVKKMKAERIVLGLKRGQCPQCRGIFQAELDVLPKALYGNRLLSQAAVMHYVHGIPIGRLLKLFGPEVTEGGLIDSFHRLGLICLPAREPLITEYRKSYVKHADETGWRTDGCGGYAWIFCAKYVTILEFRDTRASRVPKEILGEENLDGVLVVDRYNGYNRIKSKIQYCYAHLLREVEALEKEFPDDLEIPIFVDRMGLFLTQAMKIKSLGLSKNEFLKEAKKIKDNILLEVQTSYKHLGIQRIQQIFFDKKERMYHWADNPDVPAENNTAEREIRTTVLSRKTSFGSQSEKGAKTRGYIMSLLLSAQKRLKDKNIEDWLFESLNKIARNKNLKIFDLIPPIHP